MVEYPSNYGKNLRNRKVHDLLTHSLNPPPTIGRPDGYLAELLDSRPTTIGWLSTILLPEFGNSTYYWDELLT